MLDHRLYRRLRKSDETALRDLCELDRRWSQYFPDHHVWLDRAIQDLTGVGRAAFGFFTPVPNPSAGGFSSRLDGCIFLKVSEYDDSAELKNLVLRHEGDPHEMAENLKAAERLIDRTTRHCEAREITKLEIELPQNERTYTSLFIDQGFSLAATRKKYFPGQVVCILEKKIGETYTADPFNPVQVGRWLLRAILPCIIGPNEPFHLNNHNFVPCIHFKLPSPNAAFTVTDSVEYNWMMILDEPDLCDEDNIRQIIESPKRKEGQLHYVLAHSLSPKMQSLLKNNGINSFQMRELKAIAGGNRSSLNIPMQRDDVGGILTVLEQERIKEYAEHRDGFVYYLMNGIGDAIPPNQGSDCLLATFCPSWAGSEGGIVAIADIDEITESTFDEASKLYEGIPKALTDEDLAYYRLRRDKDRLCVLKCARLRLLPRLIEMKDPIWTQEMREYISQEVEHTNSAYINRDICESIRKIVAFLNSIPDTRASSESRASDSSVVSRKTERESRPGLEPRASEQPVSSRKGMRILFLAANPLELRALDLEAEERNLREVLKTTIHRGSIEIVTRLGVQPDDLISDAREHKPNIIHFSGHATKAGIILRNDKGEFLEVSGPVLKQFLEGRGIDLVVLNSCFTQAQAHTIQDAVKTVVGTTELVSDEAARKFTVMFYKSLGNGLPISEAFRDARDAVVLNKLKDVFQHSGNLNYSFFSE